MTLVFNGTGQTMPAETDSAIREVATCETFLRYAHSSPVQTGNSRHLSEPITADSAKTIFPNGDCSATACSSRASASNLRTGLLSGGQYLIRQRRLHVLLTGTKSRGPALRGIEVRLSA